MPTGVSPPPYSPPLSAASQADAIEEVDPELLALPGPPRKERTFTVAVLAITAAASIAMAAVLRPDAAYAFASSSPVDLGDLREVGGPALGDNRFATGHAMLGAAGAIRFERPFESDSYRLSPVAGRPNVWVEVRVPAGDEGARYVPPSQFRGRLARLESSGTRNRGLRKAVASTTGEAIPEGAWILVDGESPASANWAVGLLTLFLGFALWNLGAIARLVRRVG